MELQANKITNAGTVTSGALQLQLWTSAAPYAGGALTGSEMASVNLSALAPGASLNNLDRIVDYTPPPAGSDYTVLVLAEWNGTQYVVRDFINASAVTDFTTPGAVLFGTWSWQSFQSDASGDQVTLDTQFVANTNPDNPTNALNLELWALKAPYDGSGDAGGYQLAVVPLDPLPAENFYEDIQQTVDFTPPPSGTYTVVLFLTEQEGTQFVIRDYLNPTGTTAFLVKRAAASTASTGLSGATVNAAQATINLQFTAPLNAASAGDLGHFALSINGQPSTPLSIAYHAATNSVTLGAANLAHGDTVIASWHGLLDVHGNSLNGQTAALKTP